MFTLIVSNTHPYSYLIEAMGFCRGPLEMTITSAWQHMSGNHAFALLVHYNRNLAKNFLDRSGLEKVIFCILQ